MNFIAAPRVPEAETEYNRFLSAAIPRSLDLGAAMLRYLALLNGDAALPVAEPCQYEGGDQAGGEAAG
jgi:hypothetical protein